MSDAYVVQLRDRTYIGDHSEFGGEGFCRVQDPSNALVFKDELVANDVANRFGGRVITLMPDDGFDPVLFRGDLVAKK